MRILKTCVSHHDTFQIPGDFSDKTGGDINECDFGVLLDEKYHHLEICIPQLNKLFEMTDTWCVTCMDTRSFKVQDRSLDLM